MRRRRFFDAESTDKKDRTAARNSAVGLLARREHAKSELKQKLRHRGYDEETAAEVIDELSLKRLVSDERFAESFIRAKAERGQGPVRLRAELRQLQVADELIERYLQAAQVDWRRLAVEVRRRKFKQTLPTAPGERAKQVRFLQYRGFTADQIRAALGGRAVGDEDLPAEAEDDPPATDSDI